ncbi:MAG: S8 family serine peptidase [Paludibacteraceae bacterium]|nr:S8 family serine peptidase [Paludibacteraceae bacterium]
MLATLLLFILGLQPLHDAGFRGEGLTVAVIDDGFYHADDPDVFDTDRIIAYYDLLHDSLRQADMFSDPACRHGTYCLSTMLYDSPDFTGTAPDADYILIRTEDDYHEAPYEVHNLIQGLLLADSLGADIISVSLGYFAFDDTTFNYTYDDLNGMSELSRTATDIARRGRLVCVAAGNSGNAPWHYIYLPADAEDILTVGAVDSAGFIAPFSSFGPTSDGRIKPEVCAWGRQTWLYDPTRYNADTGTYGALFRGNGTSFACPEVAGMAACIWQAYPHLNAAQLRDIIIRSADSYPSPDNQRGYGVPDAARACALAEQLLDLPATDADAPAHKRIHNGQLLIHRAGTDYDLLGRPQPVSALAPALPTTTRTSTPAWDAGGSPANRHLMATP